MKVILNRDVQNLGEEGDVVDVSPGYARNFLLPGGMVLQHSAQNLSIIEARRASIEKRKNEKRKDAESLKDRLEGEPLVIRMMSGENGRLFGSVTSATIADELEKKGIVVERKRIDIPDSSLKATGNYKVRVRLYGEQEATLTVQVEGQTSSEEMAKKAKRAPAEAPAGDAPAAEDSAPADTAPAAEGAAPAEEGSVAETENAVPEEDVAAESPVEEDAADEAED